MKTMLALAFTTAAALAATDDFDDAKPGALPAKWEQSGGGAKWAVEKDDSAPGKPHVFAQRGVAQFPVALRGGTKLKDGFVEVKGKAVAGKDDQAIGVVWRAKDAENYYVCRANALENNVVLYKVAAGKRDALEIVGRKGGYGVEAAVEPGKWHTLRVEFAGDTFAVKLNGKELFKVQDATFAEAGKVGLWTKADSVTLFDDFSFGGK